MLRATVKPCRHEIVNVRTREVVRSEWCTARLWVVTVADLRATATSQAAACDLAVTMLRALLPVEQVAS